jgi:lipoprotein NlpD
MQGQNMRLTSFTGRQGWTGLAAALVLVLAGCASPRHQAPVESRANPSGTTLVKPLPADTNKPGVAGASNESKAPTYTVKPGDTLMRISLETGQSWRDIARWNNIDNPNVIEVGQALRVGPLPSEVAAVAPKPVLPAKVETRPLDGKPASAPAAGSASGTGTGAVASTAPAASLPLPPLTREGDEDVDWGWPASGPVLGQFDDNRNKGLSIGGKEGDPVLAAADGRVVYAGSGLRGYGNLVIVKHNGTFLTAYAHNQTLLVKEDQVVRKGQKIAEMGSSDADRVNLHFEIRRQGKPVDPAKLLPPR